MEKVIYFLLLGRKERLPCSEDKDIASYSLKHFKPELGWDIVLFISFCLLKPIL